MVVNTERKKVNRKEKISFISTVLSWTIFTLLVMCAGLLFYYFISLQLYAIKGDKFEPKFSLYTIISPSMTPNINVYDVIIDFRVDEPEDIKIGDVITFNSVATEHNGTIVTHRVVSIIKDDNGNFSYQTKGDYNLIADSKPVPYENIIGRVALKIPQLGRVQLFVASSFGWLFLILIPALYIIIKGIMRTFGINLEFSKHFKNSKLFQKLLPGTRHKLLPEPKIVQESDDFSLPIEKENAVVQESIMPKPNDDLDFLDDLPKLK